MKTAARPQSRWRMLVAVAAIMLGAAALACGTDAEGATLLEELLPAGHPPEWYAQQLESSGYEITAINYERKNYTEYEVVRNAASYEVQLGIDAATGSVAQVTVEDNPWQSSDTEKTIERNEASTLVPVGTRIAVTLNDYLDSGESVEGEVFGMSVAQPVVLDDEVIIPRGTHVEGRVQSVESARRPNKGGRLVLEASTLEIDDQRLELEAIVTAPAGDQGDASLEEDWKEIAGGAGLGGLIGGLIGGGKGILAGVLIGGGGMFLATKGEQVELPPDTELIVELREPVRVPR